MSETTPPYARSTDSADGPVYTVTGGDWDELFGGEDPIGAERLVVNMGPQHPGTHGVLRLVLELEGETVTSLRPVVGFLHTGIEKSCEYRTWTQGVTFVTRMDYLSPTFNEAAYCPARRSCWASFRRRAPPRSGCWSWSCSGSLPTSSRWRPVAWSSERCR